MRGGPPAYIMQGVGLLAHRRGQRAVLRARRCAAAVTGWPGCVRSAAETDRGTARMSAASLLACRARRVVGVRPSPAQHPGIRRAAQAV